MAVPQAVQAVYDESIVFSRALQAIVGATVQRWASSNDYLFKDRIKSPSSTAEKLESGRFSSWSQIDDLYACTVVVPTPAHIERTLEFLGSAFNKRDVRGRGVARKPPDVFRFDSPRFIGTLREQPEADRPQGIEDVPFEVQIVTAFEYAWAVATHDLVFKGEQVDWRHARLAAHLRAAAEEADVLITSFVETAGAIPVSPHEDTQRQQRIVNYFRAEVTSGRLPQTLAPASWTRFGKNALALLRSFRRDRVDDVIDDVLEETHSALERGPAPTSGSMFQFLTGILVHKHGTEALRRFVIVESAELRDLYGVKSVPQSFDFS